MMTDTKMAALKKIDILRAYCDYMEEHLHNVKKAWEIIQVALKNENVIYNDHLFWTIQRMIEQHDVSKTSSDEFIQYAEWFFGEHGKEWDSVAGGFHEDEHTALMAAFAGAWEHHKTHNMHHWQTWPTIPESFPNHHACHIVCMVVDWMAMGMKLGDTAEQYYAANKDKIDIPEWSMMFLQDIFVALRENTTTSGKDGG